MGTLTTSVGPFRPTDIYRLTTCKAGEVVHLVLEPSVLGLRYERRQTSQCCPFSRVVPDTNLAGYPANNFAGYRISGQIVNIEFFLKRKIKKFLVINKP